MKILLTAIIFSMFTISAQAFADIQIEMLNKDDKGNKMIYSEELVDIQVGDTITWLPTSKGHNVEFKTVPEGVDKIKKSKMNKEYSYTFEVPGVYVYWCTPHKAMGMIGVVIVGDDISNIEDAYKTKMVGKSKKKLKVLLDSYGQ
tara:strand:+ start:713 stop:1147 length:435 start_codon:yes stop_codon:yes gene_type:complete